VALSLRAAAAGSQTDRVNVLVPASPIIVLAEVVVVAVVVVLVRLLRR
jgi:hypothetical protein